MPTTAMLDAVVVGAGPNGLTAAARLATQGRKVLVIEASSTPGGGARTAPLGDARVDVCAAVHPFGASSPAFEALRLSDHGLAWLHPPLGLAHPFDDGTAAILDRSLATTSEALGRDERRWDAVVGPFARDWDTLRELALAPVPWALARHPLAMTRFGLLAALPSDVLTRIFATREARALLSGLAAHSGVSLGSPTTGGVGLALAAAAHGAGMPFAAGGTASIIRALTNVVVAHGGKIECDHLVTSLDELPRSRHVLLDVTPGQAAAICGRRAPRWRHGVAACKVDLVLSGPLPWTAPACGDAGTVHIGGEAHEVSKAERATAQGGVPEVPFVIVTQPSTVDATRAPEGQHVVWAYRHVPNGCTDPNAVEGIDRQLDRFAPGWRDLVLHRRVTTATQYAAYNPSYIGGDVAGGAMTPWQTIARPRLGADPYRTATPNVWLCSQSTPPGPGVHGMCGWHAAGRALASGA